MKQIALTRDQMKHLEKLGLNTGDASMYYSYEGNLEIIKEWQEDLFKTKVIEEKVWTPAYTLQDILRRLPNEIEITKDGKNYIYQLNLWMKDGTTYRIAYLCYNLEDIFLVKFYSKDVLECSYQMLCWCIENDDCILNNQVPMYV